MPAPQSAPAAPAPTAPTPTLAPAPASAPVATGGPLAPEVAALLGNPASLQRLWAGVLASLKKSKAAYGVLFMNTKAVFDGARFIVEFAPENDFAFRAVQKADVQEELAAALRHEAHCDVPFELRKGGAGATAPVAAAPSAGGIAQPNPVAAAAARAASGVAEAPRPTAPAPAAPAPAAPAPLAPPADDRPPYDDYVPYDDGDVPFEEVPPWEAAPAPGKSAPSPAPASQPPAAPASTPAPAAPPAFTPPAMASATGLPPEPDSVSGPSPNPVVEPDNGDLNASLAFGFGDGVSFEEVS